MAREKGGYSISAWMQHTDGTREYVSLELLQSMIDILEDGTKPEFNYEVEVCNDGWYFTFKEKDKEHLDEPS